MRGITGQVRACGRGCLSGRIASPGVQVFCTHTAANQGPPPSGTDGRSVSTRTKHWHVHSSQHARGPMPASVAWRPAVLAQVSTQSKLDSLLLQRLGLKDSARRPECLPHGPPAVRGSGRPRSQVSDQLRGKKSHLRRLGHRIPPSTAASVFSVFLLWARKAVLFVRWNRRPSVVEDGTRALAWESDPPQKAQPGCSGRRP